MNRIRELREARGWTTEQLGKEAGTTGATISRLEGGERKLTVEWMQKIAHALKVAPTDLLDNAALAEIAPDIEPAEVAALGKALIAAAKHGVRFYKVVGKSVERTGIVPDEVIAVDHAPDALAVAANGDVLVVAMGKDETLCLRQFLAPDLLATNRHGTNVMIGIGGTVPAKVLGIVMRD
jgi:transcriptional regulator with XRE-family HTH domain